MAKVIQIAEIAKEFKDIKELSNYCIAQYAALESATGEITKLKAEIAHLQQLLTASVQVIGDSNVIKIIKSSELMIVEAQIKLLSDRAMNKELTLEEVKTLDLLVKNKRLLSDESAPLDASKDKPKRQLSEAQLISIARVVKKDA